MFPRVLENLARSLEGAGELASEVLTEVAARLGEPPVGTWVRDADGTLWLRGNAVDWARDGDPHGVTSWDRVLEYAPLEIVTAAEARAYLLGLSERGPQ